MNISKRLLKSEAKQGERYLNETENRLAKALEQTLFVLQYHEGYARYNPIITEGREALAFARRLEIGDIDRRIDELESRLSR